MRIAIIGAHGTGKTTLAEKLSKATGLPLIPEAARQLIDELGRHPAGMPPHEALRFQQEVLRRQMEAESAHSDTGFVSDRSVFDNLSYWVLYGLHLRYYDEYLSAAAAACDHNRRHPYDLVVHVPVEPGVPQRESSRLACEGCRRLLDALIVSFIGTVGEARCRRILVVRGTVEDRLRTVLEHLSKGK